MTAQSTGILVDTNILVYAVDPSEPVKQQVAVAIIEELGIAGKGTISTQILGEYFNTVTRKLRPPMPTSDAEWNVRLFVREWRVFPLTADVVLAAVALVQRHSFSYWDALIWATAWLNGVRTILTEDQNDGLLLDGVRFRNPFTPHFDLAAVLQTP